VAIGEKAVELETFTALDGRQVDLASLHGKVVLIDFWATWYKPSSMPHLKEMYDKYHDKGLEVIGISLDAGLWEGKIAEGNKKQVENILKKYDLPWPQYHIYSQTTSKQASSPTRVSWEENKNVKLKGKKAITKAVYCYD
jgi:glutathione peroxidase-family protein